MYRRILIIFLVVFGFLETWAWAEGRSRLRLTTPIAAEYGDIEGATNTTEQVSGYGVEPMDLVWVGVPSLPKPSLTSR